MDADVEVPQYFICPISLHIMKDPVTVATGITYDRESIEQWLSSENNTSTCPVTKLPISKDSDLTPNHTLRRLIQAWCTINASNGVDRIPTPKSPINTIHVLQLIRQLSVPQLVLKSLKKLEEELVSENDRNRKCMVEAGVPKAMVAFIIKCFKKQDDDHHNNGTLEVALNVLHLILMHRSVSMHEVMMPQLIERNVDFMDSITWVLCRDQMEENHDVMVKTYAVTILKSIVEVADTGILYRLKKGFFETILRILRDRISYQATKSALHVLLETVAFGRNRLRIIEAGAVFELIEIELEMPEKRITELVFSVLDQLCACADGRAEFLNHASSIAMVSKRILRVSPAADEKGIRILATICKFCSSNEVLQEMLSVGGVSKLCMLLQADCSANVKDKARMVLRMHSKFWNSSPCIHIYLSTRFLGNNNNT